MEELLQNRDASDIGIILCVLLNRKKKVIKIICEIGAGTNISSLFQKKPTVSRKRFTRDACEVPMRALVLELCICSRGNV
jgi:hypothetical protein